MVNINTPPRTFIDWATLVKEDPIAFEEKRRQEIENLISRAPARLQHRLRCLQWRIDLERKRSSNPLSACLRLYSMMWDSILSDRGFLQALQKLTGEDLSVKERNPTIKSAQILPFKRVKTIHQ
ncbi:uncharacterized protein DUF3135 [Sulfurirhabdus autotrophica]|uniref:Uncharacterized protein DUF3135 n=2 Tax=Sulfurirhabdus autotrophica TaxID=1706046 RepID=A0A4R3YD98_9PROT|nr:uncharacterized protein DUF3135 [Sulfurirhabdus autotrophica]